MGDVYEAKSYDLENYINAFELVEGQKGLLVFINGEIMGLDVISSKSAYKVLHKKLIKSYALDSMVEKGNKRIKSDINSEKVQQFH